MGPLVQFLESHTVGWRELNPQSYPMTSTHTESHHHHHRKNILGGGEEFSGILKDEGGKNLKTWKDREQHKKISWKLELKKKNEELKRKSTTTPAWIRPLNNKQQLPKERKGNISYNISKIAPSADLSLLTEGVMTWEMRKPHFSFP